MKRNQLAVALLLGAMVTGSGSVFSAEKIDLGRSEYRNNCFNCHGENGDGNGPYAQLLTKRAADLTVLTKNNQGVFPFARVYEVIDGRQIVKGHGERDMPIWGSVYRAKAGEYYGDMLYDPELFVRSRILAVIEYISRLQKN